MTIIKLPVFGIVININSQGGGGISSADLQDETAGPEYEAAIDGLLSLILAHACAGIDVKSPAYLQGIEVAVESIANDYGDD